MRKEAGDFGGYHTPPPPPTTHASRPAHLYDVTAPGAPERLDGEEFSFLHAGGVAAFDDGDVLPRVNLVGTNAVAVEVAHALHWVRSAVDLDLVALHHFLDGSPDLPSVCSRRRRRRRHRRRCRHGGYQTQTFAETDRSGTWK